MYWEVGHYVNSIVLDGGRAAYGKQIVATLSSQLEIKYGNSLDVANLVRKSARSPCNLIAKIAAALRSQLETAFVGFAMCFLFVVSASAVRSQFANIIAA